MSPYVIDWPCARRDAHHAHDGCPGVAAHPDTMIGRSPASGRQPVTRWQDISPAEAAERFPNGALNQGVRLPLNENGEECPWPWDPQQLRGAPLGQYHCPYCGAMCMAGMDHIDYRDEEQGP